MSICDLKQVSTSGFACLVSWALRTTWDHLGDSVNNARTQPSCPFRCTQLDEDTEPEFFGTSLVRRENLMENVAHLANFNARAARVDDDTTAFKVNLCTMGRK